MNEMHLLAVGGVLGDIDSGTRKWARAIGQLHLDCQDILPRGDSPLSLDIQFHLAGRHLPLDFEGVRAGRFSAKKRNLIVQVAVENRTVPDYRSVLLEKLESGIQVAEAVAARKGLETPLAEIRRIISLVPTADQ